MLQLQWPEPVNAAAKESEADVGGHGRQLTRFCRWSRSKDTSTGAVQDVPSEAGALGDADTTDLTAELVGHGG